MRLPETKLEVAADAVHGQVDQAAVDGGVEGEQDSEGKEGVEDEVEPHHIDSDVGLIAAKGGESDPGHRRVAGHQETRVVLNHNLLKGNFSSYDYE